MLFCFFYCKFLVVLSILLYIFFQCIANWIFCHSIRSLYSAFIILTKCNLVDVFCKKNMCLTPETMFSSQYCLIISVAAFSVFKFNFSFYYTLTCDLCPFINLTIIPKIIVYLKSQSYKFFLYFPN